ncbi:MAG: hypothetical protein WDZ29_06160, partial [Balneolaceae bacterium]
VTEDVALAFFENNLEAYADEHGCDGNTAPCKDGLVFCEEVEEDFQQFCTNWLRCGICENVYIYDAYHEDECCFSL